MYALKLILLARWLTWRKWYIYVSYASEVGEVGSVLVPPGSHREKVYEAGMGSGDLSMLSLLLCWPESSLLHLGFIYLLCCCEAPVPVPCLVSVGV